MQHIPQMPGAATRLASSPSHACRPCSAQGPWKAGLLHARCTPPNMLHAHAAHVPCDSRSRAAGSHLVGQDGAELQFLMRTVAPPMVDTHITASLGARAKRPCAMHARPSPRLNPLQWAGAQLLAASSGLVPAAWPWQAEQQRPRHQDPSLASGPASTSGRAPAGAAAGHTSASLVYASLPVLSTVVAAATGTDMPTNWLLYYLEEDELARDLNDILEEKRHLVQLHRQQRLQQLQQKAAQQQERARGQALADGGAVALDPSAAAADGPAAGPAAAPAAAVVAPALPAPGPAAPTASSAPAAASAAAAQAAAYSAALAASSPTEAAALQAATATNDVEDVTLLRTFRLMDTGALSPPPILYCALACCQPRAAPSPPCRSSDPCFPAPRTHTVTRATRFAAAPRCTAPCADANGVIDAGELRLALQRLGLPSSREYVADVIELYDVNGDGQVRQRSLPRACMAES
jgi:hypothetical protein